MAHLLSLIGKGNLLSLSKNKITENERNYKLQIKKLNQIKDEDCDKLEREKQSQLVILIKNVDKNENY